jgi:glycosidase
LYGMPNVEGAYPPRSGNRTPMQWAPGKNLGFSTGDSTMLYLPVDTAANAPTVAAQEKNPKSLLNNFRKLTTLKRREAALAAYAELVPVYAKENSYPFIYARANGEEIILCVFNPADRKEKAEFKLNIKAKKIKLLAGDHLSIISKGYKYTVETPPVSYAIYKIFK